MTIPLNTNTYILTTSTTSSAITLQPLDAAETYIEIANQGTTSVFVVSGTGAAPTAVFPTSATVPVMGSVIIGGRTAVIPKNANHEFVSMVAASGTPQVAVSPGPNIVI